MGERTAATAKLLATQEAWQRNHAKILVSNGGLFEHPLFIPSVDKLVAADGNRRVTHLKLLNTPRRARMIEIKPFLSVAARRFWGCGGGARRRRPERKSDRAFLQTRRGIGFPNRVERRPA